MDKWKKHLSIIIHPAVQFKPDFHLRQKYKYGNVGLCFVCFRARARARAHPTSNTVTDHHQHKFQENVFVARAHGSLGSDDGSVYFRRGHTQGRPSKQSVWKRNGQFGLPVETRTSWPVLYFGTNQDLETRVFFPCTSSSHSNRHSSAPWQTDLCNDPVFDGTRIQEIKTNFVHIYIHHQRHRSRSGYRHRHHQPQSVEKDKTWCWWWCT